MRQIWLTLRQWTEICYLSRIIMVTKMRSPISLLLNAFGRSRRSGRRGCLFWSCGIFMIRGYELCLVWGCEKWFIWCCGRHPIWGCEISYLMLWETSHLRLWIVLYDVKYESEARNLTQLHLRDVSYWEASVISQEVFAPEMKWDEIGTRHVIRSLDNCI